MKNLIRTFFICRTPSERIERPNLLQSTIFKIASHHWATWQKLNGNEEIRTPAPVMAYLVSNQTSLTT